MRTGKYELIVAPSIGQHIVGLKIDSSIADIPTGSRPPLQPHMGEVVGSWWWKMDLIHSHAVVSLEAFKKASWSSPPVWCPPTLELNWHCKGLLNHLTTSMEKIKPLKYDFCGPVAIHYSATAITITDTIDYGPGSNDSIQYPTPPAESHNHPT